MSAAFLLHASGYALLALAAAGALYTLAAAWLVGRYRAGPHPPHAEAPAVTILKPLYGAEPALAANLATFLAQDYAGAVQMVCGVAASKDPAVTAVEALRAAHPGADIALVADPATHGANAKISNLSNMMAAARHDLLVLSDSDMAVAPDYLARVTGALERPGVGAVTCLYHGRGQAGFWSRLAAAGIDWHFLPSVALGVALGRARPCMGSTIALHRDTLERIGGFPRFADILADDHAIGAAVRGLGLTVTVPPMLVAHSCAETSLLALAHHELRWLATVRGLDPVGYAGSVVTHPLPLALLGAALAGTSPAPLALLALLAAALAARLILAYRVGRIASERPVSLWLLPLRDMLSFLLFGIAFGVRSVDWRGSRLHMQAKGRLAAQTRSFD